MQRLVKYLLWSLGGAALFGGFLGALNNAERVFTTRLAGNFSMIVVAIWLFGELVLRKWGLKWRSADRTSGLTKLRGFGPQIRAFLIGVILLPWAALAFAHLLPSSLPESPAEDLAITCRPLGESLVSVDSKPLGSDTSLTRSVTVQCDLANIGSERLSITTAALIIEYRTESGSSIRLEAGEKPIASVPLLDLPQAIEAGSVHRLFLPILIVRDHPDHVPVIVVEGSDTTMVMFPSTWSTKVSARGRLERVAPHYLSVLHFVFTTSRGLHVGDSLSVAQL